MILDTDFTGYPPNTGYPAIFLTYYKPFLEKITVLHFSYFVLHNIQ